MGEPLDILIADDHPAFRSGLRAMLAGVDDLRVVGEAATGDEAAALAEEMRPAVVVMDIQMPGLNGIDCTRRIATRAPEVAVVVMTMFEDDESVFAAMRAGARGYLLKGAGREEILRALRAVGNGEAIFGPDIARRFIDYFAAGARAGAGAFPQLTSREREVLELLAAGRSNAAIAGALSLSLKTVRNHVSSIFTKLRVADRAAAIVKARDAGFGRSP
jgi:DNA-binding NarL/FixJ family response regulator